MLQMISGEERSVQQKRREKASKFEINGKNKIEMIRLKVNDKCKHFAALVSHSGPNQHALERMNDEK